MSLLLALVLTLQLAPSKVEGAQDDPETERKSFQVAEGYEVSLFASDTASSEGRRSFPSLCSAKVTMPGI